MGCGTGILGAQDTKQGCALLKMRKLPLKTPVYGLRFTIYD